MYYVGRNGRQSGPHSLDELKSMAAAGNLSPGDLAWTDGMSEWKPLREALPELVALMSPAAPPPPATPPPVTLSEASSPDLLSQPAPAPPPPAPAPFLGASQPTLALGEPIPTYMWQSVAMTLLCCPITGVPAIVFASQVQSKQQVGDIAGAIKASKNAKLWCWLSVAVGVLMYVITAIAMAVVLSLANHSHF